MNLQLAGPSEKVLKADINITGSKSESNRLLLLQALYPNIHIENLSNSDDARVMREGLASERGLVDIHHAGTAMRFLTAYFASREGRELSLTGSTRMKQRPIKVLVQALQELGAEISYEGEEGCPPLAIKGKRLKRSKVSLPANISSQYISALLLIAPSLPEGIELELIGNITSVPYIKMTLGLLDQIGVSSSFQGNRIRVAPKQEIEPATLVVESDWSSASYFYSLLALCETGSTVSLTSYKKDSLQGDSVLTEIYKEFGIETAFESHRIILSKTADRIPSNLKLDLSNAPDLAQTITVTCFGLGTSCELEGLHTLKIKETDRLEALKTELGKLGASIEVTDRSLSLASARNINSGVRVATYNDHRMAMAFAPLALKTTLEIEDAMVVSKSYPDFWRDMEKLGFSLKEL